MPKLKPEIQDLLSRRHDWRPIASLVNTSDYVGARLIEIARNNRWRWVALNNTSGLLPPGLQPDGALVDKVPTDPTVRELLRRGVPTVRIGVWPHPEDDLVPAVVPDRPAAGRLAAEHFAERDFEHVAFIGRFPWAADEALYLAFMERAQELGCVCHLLQENIDALRARLPAGGDLFKARQLAFTEWLRATPKPLGIFTFGDPVAAIYCQWVVEAGLRVPEDVALLGIGNTRFVCESATVPLSSVAFDMVRLAEVATDLLAQLIRGETPAKTTIAMPPTGVVPRQSTDVLAASDPNVVKALRFMWDHVTEDLSVDQIAEHVGVSRRTLEKLFRRDIDRGVNQEFQRRRLDKACQLLRMTQLSVSEICDGLGFSCASAFCKAFRAAHGTTPSEYRSRVHHSD